MNKKVKISVVVSTFNRNKVLVDTINSVLKQDFKGFELLIVDQLPKHDSKTSAFLSKLKDLRVHYFAVSPASLPAARNFGLEKSRGQIVIYIDDDVLLDPGFIKAHFDSYKNKNVVSVVGRIVQDDKPISDRLLFLRKTSFGAGNFNYPKSAYAETVQGCNMSYRKSTLTKIGGFDTNYIGNAVREESDVSFKLRKQGYKIFYNPKASLYHRFYNVGGCREKSDIHDNYVIYRNEMLFFLRHRPLRYFPYFFGGHLFKFVLNRKLIARHKFWLRFWVFVKGLIVGSWIFFFPRARFTSQELDYRH